MKSENEPKRAAYTRKTKDDFLRWLRKQEALKKQVADDENYPIKWPKPPRKR